MKFKNNQIVFYVDSTSFKIEKIKITVEEDIIYPYIDQTGAYYMKDELFADLKEAKKVALKKLSKFYFDTGKKILNANPKLLINEEGYINEEC